LGPFGYDPDALSEWTRHLVSAPLARFYTADLNVPPDHFPGDLSLLRLLGHGVRPVDTGTDSAVRRLALEADGVLTDLLDLAAADVTSARADKQRAAARRVQGLRDHLERLEGEVALARLQSPLDGNALMALFNRPPGRWIAEVKDHLRELVIDGELAPDDTETATRIARELLQGTSPL
jgi:poly(A) polymerase